MCQRESEIHRETENETERERELQISRSQALEKGHTLILKQINAYL